MILYFKGTRDISDLHVQSRVAKNLEFIIVGNCEIASTTHNDI